MQQENRLQKPYLLFDAGGALVFPDHPLLARLAREEGVQVTGQQLFEAHFQLIHAIDSQARHNGRLVVEWPKGYAATLSEHLGWPADTAGQIEAKAREEDRKRSLWTFTFPWVAKTLAALAEAGYRMSVISNADGRAPTILQELGLAGYFEAIFDSHIVGVEKPDPAIFALAFAELGIKPEAALYVGDVFFIDVWGANRAGLGAVHLDPLGLYQDWPGVHLRDIRQLPAWLAAYARSEVAGEELFAANGFAIEQIQSANGQ